MTLLSVIGWILTIPVLFFLVKSGFDKIRGTNESVGNFKFMKLENHRMMIGLLEIIAAIMLVIPSLSFFGLLLTVSLMSGAVALHLSLMGGNKTWFPVMVGVLSVLSYLIR